MEKFTNLICTMLPIPHVNIDTDQIIPASYLKVTTKEGLAEGLFARWCYLPDGSLDPDFALNKPHHQGAQVLVAGDNFGTGSSREHAPWALLGRGFRAVVSTSFADIFRNNALKNGLLPVVIDEQTHQQLMSLASEDPKAQIEIDLANQTLKLPDHRTVTFHIDSFSKICLLEGVDQLGYLLNHEPEIAAYEKNLEGDKFYERGL